MTYPTPYDFSCVGNGRTDDTAGLQRWLDSGPVLHCPPGVFAHGSDHLLIRSGTSIHGTGGSRSILLNLGDYIVMNERMQSDPAGGMWDSDIEIHGMGFQGESNRPLPDRAEFVTLCGIQNLRIEDCVFAHRRGTMLLIANNVNMRISCNDLYDWGILTHDHQGDGQYSGTPAIFCWRPSWHAWITDNYLHDGAIGIWLPVPGNLNPEVAESSHFIVSGNQVINCTEANAVCSPEATLIYGNLWDGCKRVDISGHNTENHGNDFAYALNYHGQCDGNGSYFSNTQNAAITGNVYRHSGGYNIVLASQSPAANVGGYPPSSVTLADNVGHDGMLITDYGGGAASSIDYKRNNCGTLTVTPGAIKR